MPITLNPDAPREDERVWGNILDIGRRISKIANKTTAPIGIMAHYEGRGKDRKVRIGPRGAPAIALEFGTARSPARRFVKRALDKFRIG